MFNLPVLLSIIPFLVFLILLLWMKTSLLRAAGVTLALFTILAIFYWQILPVSLLASYIKGFLVAFDIFIIVFGAIFFLGVLKDLDVIKNISYYLEHFSKDYRVQIIILAWFFENFIEGTAGFGTPVVIVVPLLIGLGLPVVKALAVALLGNSASVVFGAAGAPIRIGFAGLDISSVPYISSLINCIGFIVPIFMLWIITSGRKNWKNEFFEGLKFSIWSGIAFVVPSVLAAAFLGQEFPSIIGSIVGLLLVMLSIKFNIFTPKNVLSLRGEEKIEKTMSAFKSFLPYGILVLILIVGKLIFGNTSVNIHLIVNHAFSLFNPGFAFLIAGLIIAFIWRSKKGNLLLSTTVAFKRTITPFLVIVSMSAFVQLMINSGQNHSGLPAAIVLIAKGFEISWLPFFAPFIGAFGSFITGSATISNIMFGNFFNAASQALGFSTAVMLSLGVVGASAGNMIALADMLAGEAVVGVKNQERQILKKVFVPCATYLVIVGIIGMAIIHVWS
ncbi:MAG: L-lactate permease [Candidatus Paceibacterota bacterium]|jgi:lactate permease